MAAMDITSKKQIAMGAKLRTSLIDQLIEANARALLRIEPKLKTQLWRSLLDGRSIGKAKRMIAIRETAERKLITLLKDRYRDE